MRTLVSAKIAINACPSGHFECGEPPASSCAMPGPACDCGASVGFVAGVGCVASAVCPTPDPRPLDVLCVETEGILGGPCMWCGRPSVCAAPCQCGDLEIFDSVRGCIRSPRCDVRYPGERCDASGACGRGTVCCATGAGSSCVHPDCGGGDCGAT